MPTQYIEILGYPCMCVYIGGQLWSATLSPTLLSDKVASDLGVVSVPGS